MKNGVLVPSVVGLVLVVLVAEAQISSTGSSVQIRTLDGGPLRVGVDDSVRLDVSSAQPEGTTYAVSGLGGGPVISEVTGVDGGTVAVAGPNGSRLTVEALGPLGGPLWVTGPSGGAVISELGQQTANLITNPVCTFAVPQITTIGTTPVQLPTADEFHADPTTSPLRRSRAPAPCPARLACAGWETAREWLRAWPLRTCSSSRCWPRIRRALRRASSGTTAPRTR